MGYVIVFVLLFVIAVVWKIKKDQGGSATSARLRGFGIVVDGDLVKSGNRIVGPLAGARAEVTDGTSRHTLTRVVTVAGAMTKKTKASVIVSCTNGGFHENKIEGAAVIRRAQSWAIRFNTMAAAQPTVSSGPASAGG